MPTCPDGHESPAYAQFCTTCGKAVRPEVVAESTPLVATMQPPPAAPPASPPMAPPAAPMAAPAAPMAAPMAPPPMAPPAAPMAPPAAPMAGYGPPASPVAGPGGYPAQRPPAAPAGYPPVGGLPATGPRYQFQLRRLTLIDQITGAGSLVLFVALWLPWFGYPSTDYSLGGINAHSYLAFAVVTSLVLISYLAARAGWDRLPVRLPIAHAPLLLVVGLVQLLLVLIAFLDTPANGLDRQAGAWIGLIAAIAASLPIVIPAIQASQRR